MILLRIESAFCLLCLRPSAIWSRWPACSYLWSLSPFSPKRAGLFGVPWTHQQDSPPDPCIFLCPGMSTLLTSFVFLLKCHFSRKMQHDLSVWNPDQLTPLHPWSWPKWISHVTTLYCYWYYLVVFLSNWPPLSAGVSSVRTRASSGLFIALPLTTRSSSEEEPNGYLLTEQVNEFQICHLGNLVKLHESSVFQFLCQKRGEEI